jgi:hypothetical protein
MQQGMGAIPEMIKTMINHAMQAEPIRYLQAEERMGYSNSTSDMSINIKID